jgi:hypothetical protein
MGQRAFIPAKRESDASALNSESFRCSLVCIRDNQQSNHTVKAQTSKIILKRSESCSLSQIAVVARSADSGMHCSKVN